MYRETVPRVMQPGKGTTEHRNVTIHEEAERERKSSSAVRQVIHVAWACDIDMRVRALPDLVWIGEGLQVI